MVVLGIVTGVVVVVAVVAVDVAVGFHLVYGCAHKDPVKVVPLCWCSRLVVAAAVVVVAEVVGAV